MGGLSSKRVLKSCNIFLTKFDPGMFVSSQKKEKPLILITQEGKMGVHK